MLADSRRAKIIAGAIWALAIGGIFLWAHAEGYGVEQVLRLIYRFVSRTTFGPVIYIILYCLRPFTFFPAMFLTVLSGTIFGFWEGWLVAIIGENSSANVAYFIGRYFGGDTINTSQIGLVKRWRPALREQAIPTVMILRAAYLPSDPVNYGCGLIALPWVKYFIGTFVGIMPPMVTFVTFGSSLQADKLLDMINHFNPHSLFHEQQLIISGALFVVSLTIAVAVHIRHRKKFQQED